MTRLAILILFSMGFGWSQELTQEEQWATQLAIYHSQDWLSWWQKSPVDTTLTEPVEPGPRPVLGLPIYWSPEPKPTGGSGTVTDEQLREPKPDPGANIVLPSSGVGRLVPSEEPIRVNLAQITTGPRAMVSLSPGLNIGRGVWSWRGTACNMTDVAQHVDQGDLEQIANGAGIPTIGYGEASVSNQLFINKSRPVVGSQIVQGASGLGTVLIASRVIAASGVWGAAFGGAFYAAGELVKYFKSVTPSDLTQRFAGTTILVDNLTATLGPRSGPNHCASWEFFARFSGKKAVAQSGIPLY